MYPAKLGILCAVLGLTAGSFALAEEPQESASPDNHGLSQSSEAQSTAAPMPAEGDSTREAAHVRPDPPQHPMGNMPYPQMAAMMQMDDTEHAGMVLLDQLEWRSTAEGNAGVWDAEGWYGGDINKVWLRSEGERVGGTTQDARADLLLDHVFARWWSVQAGAAKISVRARGALGQRSASKDSRPIGSTPKRHSMSVSKGAPRRGSRPNTSCSSRSD